MNRLDWRRPITRRSILKGAGAFGLAGLTTPLLSTIDSLARAKGPTPLQHIVVDMQENRSFDHYYGFAPWIGSYGVPGGYSQPDGNGGSVKPYHFTSLSTPDIGHSWNATHSEWDHGKMDGFYTTDGLNCLGSTWLPTCPFTTVFTTASRSASTISVRCSAQPGPIGSTWRRGPQGA